MFRQINLLALLLATLVIISFIGAAISIAEENILAMILCILLGFLIMGYGIHRKRSNS
ncbi:MAG TPA: DUF5325 family protein [Bacillota bacterium]|nr:DUF5325 family protein [Bacillota bacterium]